MVSGATRILSAASPVTGEAFEVQSVNRTFQIDLSGLGSAATVGIDVSVSGESFDELYSVEMADNAATGSVTVCLASAEPFNYVRARVVSLTGGGTVTVFAGDLHERKANAQSRDRRGWWRRRCLGG